MATDDEAGDAEREQRDAGRVGQRYRARRMRRPGQRQAGGNGGENPGGGAVDGLTPALPNVNAMSAPAR
jgi:hypothetical protein